MQDEDLTGREAIICLSYLQVVELLMLCVPWLVLDTIPSGGKEEYKSRS